MESWRKNASGVVKEVYTSPVVAPEAKGDTRKLASQEDPAYLIEQEDGSQVLKNESELMATPD